MYTYLSSIRQVYCPEKGQVCTGYLTMIESEINEQAVGEEKKTFLYQSSFWSFLEESCMESSLDVIDLYFE